MICSKLSSSNSSASRADSLLEAVLQSLACSLLDIESLCDRDRTSAGSLIGAKPKRPVRDVECTCQPTWKPRRVLPMPGAPVRVSQAYRRLLEQCAHLGRRHPHDQAAVLLGSERRWYKSGIVPYTWLLWSQQHGGRAALPAAVQHGRIGQCQQALRRRRVAGLDEGRNKARRQGREIGNALVLLKTADLPNAVAGGQRQVTLSHIRLPAQMPEQVSEGRVRRSGRGGVAGVPWSPPKPFHRRHPAFAYEDSTASILTRTCRRGLCLRRYRVGHSTVSIRVSPRAGIGCPARSISS